MFEAITSWDLSVLHWIADHVQCGFLDAVMPVVTLLGEHGIFCIALSVVLMIFPKTRKTGVTVAVALALGYLIGNLTIKPIVDRVRPYELDEALRSAVIFKFPHDASFPSGHTLAAFETSVSIFLRNKKWGSLALVLAFLVALSRLYLTVHYPTDVICGAVLGTGFAIAAFFLVDFVWKKIAERKAKAK